MKKRTPADSVNIHTELIMPGHTNPLGNLMGGNLLSWMDVSCGVSALRHCGTICVTASVDNVSFKMPIKVGDVVVMKSFVTRAFNTSLEVCCEVFIHNPQTHVDVLSHTAYFTFVALDSSGKTIRVPELEPISEKDKKLYESAEQRRELRLFLAGKMPVEEVKFLRNILACE